MNHWSTYSWKALPQIFSLKNITQHFCKKLYSLSEKKYLDLGLFEHDTIIVAGTGRSGTTWIGDVIAFSTKSRLIFEPFLLDSNMKFALLKPHQVDESQLLRNYQLYIPYHPDSNSKHHKDIKRILRGRISSTWSEKQARRGLFRHRVIKEIRANLFLGYIARKWPRIKIIFVIRNPLSLANSMLSRKQKGWDFDWNCNDVLMQENLMEDRLQPFYEQMKNAESLEERLAHKWCIETLIALDQISGLENVKVVRYEKLIKGEEEWSRLANFLSAYGWSEKLFHKYLHIPSSTTEKEYDQIFNRVDNHPFLDAGSKSAIEAIVRTYGLERFMNE
jgi:hypothetical protein